MRMYCTVLYVVSTSQLSVYVRNLLLYSWPFAMTSDGLRLPTLGAAWPKSNHKSLYNHVPHLPSPQSRRQVAPRVGGALGALLSQAKGPITLGPHLPASFGRATCANRNDQGPIRLPTTHSPISRGNHADVSGWGPRARGSSPPTVAGAMLTVKSL